jgi:hypothetical protein
LRQKARFSLQQTQTDQPLPHAKEAKVQAGGLFGLQQAIESADPAQVEALDDHRLRYNESDKLIANIYGLLDKAANQYKQLDRLPYSEMVKSILRFEVRKKRSRNRNKT